MPRQWKRLGAAVLLAVCIHACMVLMVVFEITWHSLETVSAPMLDLRPLTVTMAFKGHEPGVSSSGAAVSGQVPVRIVPDEAHVGAGSGTQHDVLRAVRSRINAVWQPTRPEGTGRAVVLLTINGQGRIVAGRMLRVQGNDAFRQFMTSFLAHLGTLDFSVPAGTGEEIRVECEFSVGE